ncbi:hypothetical protein WJ438_25405 [Streptomyces sp. GD-15H]|uniref:hypothetical protein n=1 Tax=Streptomyces sp. GD-15H TaxID=3129112 RepID=UPI00324B275C
MTKKTRIRVARIAAGAVIAAGASLTAAGAASALDLTGNAGVSEEGVNLGISANLDDEDPAEPTIPTEPDPVVPDPVVPDPVVPDPVVPDPVVPDPVVPDPVVPDPVVPDPVEPDPVEDPTTDPSTPGNGGGNGGGNAADPAGGSGPSTQEQGSSALTDTGEAPATLAQGNGQELAETGAAEMTFLVIGAATMIAGGIGFRVLPRLMAGGGGATA